MKLPFPLVAARSIIRYRKRPFETADQINDALLGAWRDEVASDDTVVCGGDIAMAGLLTPERARAYPVDARTEAAGADAARRRKPGAAGDAHPA